MPGWLGKLFGVRTAVQASRENPVLLATIAKSSVIYARIPLRDFIEEENRRQLSRQLFLDINAICNSIDPVTTCREKLSISMLDLALFQVLLVPPMPEVDSSELRGQPGISGELGEHFLALARKNSDLSAKLRDLPEPLTSEAVWESVQRSYWILFWFLESFNAARIELGDHIEDDDWFKPFKHAACANREHIYRRELAMPSCFDDSMADSAPTAYSIFTDIILSGADNPLREWREYYQASNIPEPDFSR